MTLFTDKQWYFGNDVAVCRCWPSVAGTVKTVCQSWSLFPEKLPWLLLHPEGITRIAYDGSPGRSGVMFLDSLLLDFCSNVFHAPATSPTYYHNKLTPLSFLSCVFPSCSFVSPLPHTVHDIKRHGVFKDFSRITYSMSDSLLCCALAAHCVLSLVLMAPLKAQTSLQALAKALLPRLL